MKIKIGWKFVGVESDIEYHELIKSQNCEFSHKGFKTEDGLKRFVTEKIGGVYTSSIPSWKEGVAHIPEIGMKFWVDVDGVRKYKGTYSPNPVFA